MPYGGGTEIPYEGMDGLSNEMEVLFYTCGYAQRPRARDLDEPIILEIDCREMRAPPEVCEHMTGQHPVFKQRFFSNPHNADILEEQLQRLHRTLRRWRGGPCAVVVFCAMGVHRSVATAEVLAQSVGASEPEHVTMEEGFARYRERKRLERMGLFPRRRRR